MWIKLLSVYGLGLIGLWESVPAGFALRLPPTLIGLVSALGSLTASLLVLLLGDRIRSRLLARRAKPDADAAAKPERLIDRVWRRYGIIGLGLVGPGLTGAPLGIALGLSLRAPARPLMLWTALGVVLWTVVLTLGGMAGTAGILRLIGR
jgi:hypothetical protein